MNLDSGDFDPQSLRENIVTADNTLERMSKIILGLSSIARNSASDPPVSYPLSTVIEELQALSQERFKRHNVTLEYRLAANDAQLLGRPTELLQVLMNLLNNAFDAVGSAREKWVRVSTQVVGDRVEISVSDSGPGVPEDLGEKIFHPFFTTKAVGKGTGLGLPICAGLIRTAQGTLTYNANAGATEFLVNLPTIDR